MIDAGFLGDAFGPIMTALATFGDRAATIRAWTRLEDFLLSVQEIRHAVVLDVAAVPGRLPALVSVSRRLTAAKILAFAADDEVAEASSVYEHGLDAVVSKRLASQHAAAQIYSLAIRQHAVPRSTTFAIGDFSFDEISRVITLGGETLLRLTEKESQLLGLFVRSSGEVIPREQISLEVFALPYQPNDRRIDMHVSNLRRKLRSARVPFALYPSRGGGYLGA